MNIKPLKTVEDSWNDTLIENREATAFDIVNSDRNQAYTSLIEGIEGMKSPRPTNVPSQEWTEEEKINDILDDIIEKVVKPLYGKE